MVACGTLWRPHVQADHRRFRPLRPSARRRLHRGSQASRSRRDPDRAPRRLRPRHFDAGLQGRHRRGGVRRRPGAGRPRIGRERERGRDPPGGCIARPPTGPGGHRRGAGHPTRRRRRPAARPARPRLRRRHGDGELADRGLRRLRREDADRPPEAADLGRPEAVRRGAQDRPSRGGSRQPRPHGRDHAPERLPPRVDREAGEGPRQVDRSHLHRDRREEGGRSRHGRHRQRRQGERDSAVPRAVGVEPRREVEGQGRQVEGRRSPRAGRQDDHLRHRWGTRSRSPMA